MKTIKTIPEEFKKHVQHAEDLFLEQKGVHPMVAVFAEDGEIFPILFDLPDDIPTRSKVFFAMGQTFKRDFEKMPKFIIFVSEAWKKTIDTKKESVKSVLENKRVRDLPDKEEILIIDYSSIDGERVVSIKNIIRDGDKVTLGKEEVMDKVEISLTENFWKGFLTIDIK